MIGAPPDLVEVDVEAAQNLLGSVDGLHHQEFNPEVVLGEVMFHAMADSPLDREINTVAFLFWSIFLKLVLYYPTSSILKRNMTSFLNTSMHTY